MKTILKILAVVIYNKVIIFCQILSCLVIGFYLQLLFLSNIFLLLH